MNRIQQVSDCMPVRARRAAGSAAITALSAVVLTAAAALPSLGLAATGSVAASDNSFLEEVVVTARRREENSQDVPVSINTFSGEALKAYNITKLEDVQLIAPSLSISMGTGRRNTPVFAIRGIRPTEALYGQDPVAGIYFADVALSPYQGMNLAMYDLENVQVLKGPQGTLFGRNTPAGAVLFTPRRPGDRRAGEISVGIGSRKLFETEFGFDVPFSETFRMRIAGRTAGQQGHQTNVGTVGATATTTGLQLTGPSLNGEKYGGYQERAVRITAVWSPTDNVENTTVLSWDRGTGSARAARVEAFNAASTARFYAGGPPFNLPAVLSMSAAFARSQARDIDLVEGNFPMSEYARTAGLFNTTTVQLSNGLTLKNIFGYRSMAYRSSFDLDASPAPMLESIQPADLHHASDELQLSGKSFNDKLDWVTGIYYYRETGTELSDGRIGGQTFLGISGSARTVNGGSVDNKASAVFAQGNLQLSPQWRLTAGARYNKDKKQSTMINQNVGPAAPSCVMVDANNVLLPLSACSRTVSKDFSANTATLSLDYKPAEGLLAYVTARRGYRSGGFNMRAQSEVQFQPFLPEFVTDTELGLKADWRAGGWQFRTNLALFRQKYKDAQRTVSTLNASQNVVTVIRNAGQATIDGVEWEGTIAPTKNFQARINFTHLKAKYNEYLDPQATNPALRDLSSTPFAWTPNNSGSLALLYTKPLGGNGNLHFQGSWSFKSRQWTNPFGTSDQLYGPGGLQANGVLDTIIQKPIRVVDLNVRWEDVMGRPFDITAYAKNATNERYAVGGLSLYATLGVNEKVYNDPRLIGLRVSYKFGGNEPARAPAPAAAPPPPAPVAAPLPPPPPPAPVDSDHDGVVDTADRCPNTPAGAAVDANGCELDGDRDGVVDRLDKCLNTPAGDKVDAVGCSLSMALEVKFDTNSANIKPESFAVLDEFAGFLAAVPSARGDLEGHTDSVGADAYNQALSQKRADAVKAYVAGKGVDAARLNAIGYGESRPIADNKSAEGRAQNRRVLFTRAAQ